VDQNTTSQSEEGMRTKLSIGAVVVAAAIFSPASGQLAGFGSSAAAAPIKALAGVTADSSIVDLVQFGRRDDSADDELRRRRRDRDRDDDTRTRDRSTDRDSGNHSGKGGTKHVHSRRHHGGGHGSGGGFGGGLGAGFAGGIGYGIGAAIITCAQRGDC
jgi:hypothetical protein